MPVVLASLSRELPAVAIIDSGADDIMFPASYAARIGLDLQRGAYYQFGGAGSDGQAAWFFEITLRIMTVISYTAYVGFTPALESVGCGLLGQNGFFDKFKVDFDLANGLFYLEAP
ncbi:MAG TPA: aspartyl protease family protein [Candidatus Acidoferrales bacterium]